MFQKRKDDLTLKEKYEISIFIENNPEMKRIDIARHFHIPESTLSRLASNIVEIRTAYEENTSSLNAKRMRKPSLESIDASLLTWFKQVRSNRPAFPISGEMLITKANEFANMIGCDKVVSKSWISRWKNRHHIIFKKLVGEASAVDMTTVDEWLTIKVPLILQEYCPETYITLMKWDSLGEHYQTELWHLNWRR